MVRNIRFAECVLGDFVKQPALCEEPVRIAARRSVTLARDCPADVPLAADDLCLMRPGDGIAPVELPEVVGRRLKAAAVAGTTLHWSDLS